MIDTQIVKRTALTLIVLLVVLLSFYLGVDYGEAQARANMLIPDCIATIPNCPK
jgi:hypothetical protein